MAAEVVVAIKADSRLLELCKVTMQFGGVTAMSEVDLAVDEGEIAGLIGPNGAGKTTVFNVITGVFRPTAGEILFRANSIVGLKRYQVTRAGIARTFQNIRLFPDMTALENVMVGADAHHRTSVPSAMLRLPRHLSEERHGRAEAMDLLELVGIAHRVEDSARNLPYGDQRRLEIARALATKPKLLLLDEPAAGFNPAEKRHLSDLIRRIRDAGYTVLLIEHDMGVVMNLCDRVSVLDFGRKIAEGQPAAIQADQRVINAYLGVTADA
ncbi:MAG TPA: ABC transporter ATP-binding protein [Acidimicrobiales bacterium]|nr:ABC transporter ATP-binding protein [Acidimicrobiales bacterium]